MINEEAKKIVKEFQKDIIDLTKYKNDLCTNIKRKGTAKKIDIIENKIDKKKNAIYQMNALEEDAMSKQLPTISSKVANIIKKNTNNYDITNIDVEYSFKKYYKIDDKVDLYTFVLNYLEVNEENINDFFNNIEDYIKVEKKLSNVSQQEKSEKSDLTDEIDNTNAIINKLTNEIKDLENNSQKLKDIQQKVLKNGMVMYNYKNYQDAQMAYADIDFTYERKREYYTYMLNEAIYSINPFSRGQRIYESKLKIKELDNNRDRARSRKQYYKDEFNSSLNVFVDNLDKETLKMLANIFDNKRELLLKELKGIVQDQNYATWDKTINTKINKIKEAKNIEIELLQLKVKELKNSVEKMDELTEDKIEKYGLTEKEKTSYQVINEKFPRVKELPTNNLEEITNVNYMKDLYKVYSIVNKTSYKAEDYIDKILIKNSKK